MRWRSWNALIGWGSAAAAAVVVLLAVSSTAAARTTDASVVRGLERLVSAPGGPIGSIATLYRNGRTTVLRAGRADVTRPRAPRVGDHMRIASIAKAFSGAVALHLVAQGRLGLDATIGQELPRMMPPTWSAVTVRQMLNHTSGLPDYTQSDGFREQATKDPRGYVSPMRIIDWVRRAGLNFTPGSRYEYSNTDNIVVGLITQRVSGRSYGQLLSRIVFQPARLTQTTFPTLVSGLGARAATSMVRQANVRSPRVQVTR